MSNDKLNFEVQIPGNIEAKIENELLIFKKENTELKRKISPLVNINLDGEKLTVKIKSDKKMYKRNFGTMVAHIKNMIKGLEEGFKYRLDIANVHFPMNVSYEKESNIVIIKNFLGEKKDRIAKIPEDVEIKVNKDFIEVSSSDIEKAGQAAANIEKTAKVRNKDRRIYQDGIFIVEKPGGSFL